MWTLAVWPQLVQHCGCVLRTVQVLVVSEVDRVHTVLYPLLRRDLQKQGGRLVSAIEAGNSSATAHNSSHASVTS
jgi:hypothetical protein